MVLVTNLFLFVKDSDCTKARKRDAVQAHSTPSCYSLINAINPSEDQQLREPYQLRYQ